MSKKAKNFGVVSASSVSARYDTRSLNGVNVGPGESLERVLETTIHWGFGDEDLEREWEMYGFLFCIASFCLTKFALLKPVYTSA